MSGSDSWRLVVFENRMLFEGLCPEWNFPGAEVSAGEASVGQTQVKSVR